MILLDTTNRSLEVILGGAVTTNQLPFVASYVDITTSAFTPATNTGATNNTTAVTLVAAPGASTQRQLKFLSVRNSDTAPATVTIRYNDNTTIRVLFIFTLAVGDSICYSDGGWRVFDSSGNNKVLYGKVSILNQGAGIANTDSTGTLLTPLTTPSGTVVGTSDTQTLTNKRITPRITTITSSATPTINTDNCDCVTITALAVAITSMTTNLSGTPNNFDMLMIRFKDDGTARAITWGTSYASSQSTLPTTTVISKVLTVGLLWDSVKSKWVCLAVDQEP